LIRQTSNLFRWRSENLVRFSGMPPRGGTKDRHSVSFCPEPCGVDDVDVERE
jgi:hypothetical protein